MASPRPITFVLSLQVAHLVTEVQCRGEGPILTVELLSQIFTTPSLIGKRKKIEDRHMRWFCGGVGDCSQSPVGKSLAATQKL